MVDHSCSAAALVRNKAISSHFLIDLTQVLEEKGFPEQKIENMLKCGSPVDFLIVKQCSKCKVSHTSQGKYHCNRRTCSYCNQKRQRRIVSQYVPYLQYYVDKKKGDDCTLKFLTINPQNYKNLKEGIKDIYKTLGKFRRRKYISERIKAGIWVIEANYNYDLDNWNVHVHMIFYGRRLDHYARGKCFDCNQNLIKFDYDKKPYCANHKCNSTNVYYKKDSKLVREWKKSSKKEVNIRIEQIYNQNKMVQYLTKKIAYMGKYDMESVHIEKMADFIMATDKQRLINKFGDWHSMPMPKMYAKCNLCSGVIDFFVHPLWFEDYVAHMESKGPPKTPYYLRGLHVSQQFLMDFNESLELSMEELNTL